MSSPSTDHGGAIRASFETARATLDAFLADEANLAAVGRFADMCHEALKTATGHDFGYDHLGQNQQDTQLAVLRWRQWWGEYSGDAVFAKSYEQAHGLDSVAAPAGETQPTEGLGGDTPAPETGSTTESGGTTESGSTSESSSGSTTGGSSTTGSGS